MESTRLKDSAGEAVAGLQFLSKEQVLMIDEALDSVGSFGEVRLSVRKGKLRFLVMQKSFDALRGKVRRKDMGLLPEKG